MSYFGADQAEAEPNLFIYPEYWFAPSWKNKSLESANEVHFHEVVGEDEQRHFVNRPMV